MVQQDSTNKTEPIFDSFNYNNIRNTKQLRRFFSSRFPSRMFNFLSDFCFSKFKSFYNFPTDTSFLSGLMLYDLSLSRNMASIGI